MRTKYVTGSADAEDKELRDSLLISCPGDGGLVFISNGNNFTLSRQPATGIYWSESTLLSACQDDGGRELWIVENPVPRKVRLSEDALDIHDVFLHENRIYIAATERNSVICLSSDLEKIDEWGLPGENDSSHLNSINFYEGRILASIFGRFDTNRQYKEGTAGLGQVIDIKSGDIFLDGLSQPHSLTVDGDLLYLCSSEDKQLRVYKGQSLVEKVDLPGYTRGIGVGKKKLYIGISRSRNIEESAHSLPSGAVMVIDKESMQVEEMLPITQQEIYDIRVVPDPGNLFALATGLLQRNIDLINNAHRKNEELEELTRQLRTEMATTQAELATTRAELATAQAELATARAELATAQAELARERAEAGAAQAESLRIQTELNLVLNSRSWAITKPLRAANRIFRQR